MADDQPRGGVLNRLERVESLLDRIEAECDSSLRKIERLDEQITGERGLNAAVKELAAQVAGLRKAAWWLAGIIVTASIGFAFGVLALIPA